MMTFSFERRLVQLRLFCWSVASSSTPVFLDAGYASYKECTQIEHYIEKYSSNFKQNWQQNIVPCRRGIPKRCLRPQRDQKLSSCCETRQIRESFKQNIIRGILIGSDKTKLVIFEAEVSVLPRTFVFAPTTTCRSGCISRSEERKKAF